MSVYYVFLSGSYGPTHPLYCTPIPLEKFTKPFICLHKKFKNLRSVQTPQKYITHFYQYCITHCIPSLCTLYKKAAL